MLKNRNYCFEKTRFWNLTLIQNQQKLRPSVTKDTFYLGANTTQEIDMSKIFGADRNVITPDNLNLEATFITAKKIDGSSGDTGNIQLTLNYKEQ